MSTKKTIRIGKKRIGPGQPCFIIAEAGVNHNGSVMLARRLIDAASACGADAVKFQTFRAEDIVCAGVRCAAYQREHDPAADSQDAMLKKLELNPKAFGELKKYCVRRKIMFLSTPHAEDAVKLLYSLVPAYKIASGDITNIPLLVNAAKRKKPLILSTGMATLREVQQAVAAVRRYNKNVILLHCTTSYPCPTREVNLRAMEALEKVCPGGVGYSDHTLGQAVSIAAVARGAVVIEKHFTLDKNIPGPDHKASLMPDEFAQMVASIRRVELALGSDKKKPTRSERDLVKLVRKSVVSAKAIPAGRKITAGMLAIKRPAGGIFPGDINKVVGKKAKKDIPADTVLQWNMLTR